MLQIIKTEAYLSGELVAYMYYISTACVNCYNLGSSCVEN